MDKYVFAITGATGSGKSTVSDIMRNLGVFVVDADKIAHEITSVNKKCIMEIRNTFGDEVFSSDGTIDRKKLGSIVFKDDNKLKLLNSITHKYIKERIKEEILKSDSEINAIDGAVIIGSPVMDLCQTVVVVTSDEQTRKKRIMKRDNISPDMAESRINSQMKNEEYKKYADFIIENNDDNVGLEECVEQLYNKIKVARES